ncbi:MAG TPA: ABC transporter ATP-binding protein [Xanthobacteraceae bacterium]|jgi:branched-chain amino acid transport system ATP-binding protein|nr:ABC transporter ATP-binding protein [Xanthobacteraceae bacterium]
MTDLFTARNLCKRFGGVHALRNVDVTQRAGETLGMIGPNGSGKTSFVNAVTGELALDSGRIDFEGAEITGARPHKVADAGLARTFQAVRLFGKLSVRDNLETAMLVLEDPAHTLEAAERLELLQWLKLDNRLQAEAGSLTLFEQRRLELAMRLMMRPRLIMLDEPVGGLAPGEIRAMMQILQELKARCSIFVIEHTMRVIRELADRVVVLIIGEKIADGPPAEILKDKRVVEQYLGTAHA